MGIGVPLPKGDIISTRHFLHPTHTETTVGVRVTPPVLPPSLAAHSLGKGSFRTQLEPEGPPGQLGTAWEASGSESSHDWVWMSLGCGSFH